MRGCRTRFISYWSDNDLGDPSPAAARPCGTATSAPATSSCTAPGTSPCRCSARWCTASRPPWPTSTRDGGTLHLRRHAAGPRRVTLVPDDAAVGGRRCDARDGVALADAQVAPVDGRIRRARSVHRFPDADCVSRNGHATVVPAPSPTPEVIPREFFVLSRAALRRTPPRPVSSCPPAPSVQLELRAAHRGGRGARGDRDRSDRRRVATPVSPATLELRRHADRHGAHRAGRGRGDGHRPRRSVARPPRSRPPPSRAASSSASARRPRPPSARPAAAKAKAEREGKRWVQPDPHLARHLRLRLALGQDPRRHRPRRHHRHPALRHVQGHGHRRRTHARATATRSRSATGTAPISWYGHMSKRIAQRARPSCRATLVGAGRQHRPLHRPAPAPRDPPERATDSPIDPMPLAASKHGLD